MPAGTNEDRLLAEVRQVLANAMAPDRVAALHAEGAALSLDATYALLREGLELAERRGAQSARDEPPPA